MSEGSGAAELSYHAMVSQPEAPLPPASGGASTAFEPLEFELDGPQGPPQTSPPPTKPSFRNTIETFFLKIPLVPYVALVVAVTTVAFQPPFFLYLPRTPSTPFLQMIWWFTASAILLGPLWLNHILTLTAEQKDFYKRGKTMTVYCVMTFAVVFWTVGWTVSLETTSLLNATMFMQLHPLYFVVIRSVTERRVRVLEVMGVFLGYSGVVVMVLESGPKRAMALKHGSQIIGNMLALGSSICVAIYIKSGQYLRQVLPGEALSFPLSIVMVVTSAAVAFPAWSPPMTTEGLIQPIIVDGLFGCFHNGSVATTVFFLGGFTAFSTYAYTYAFKCLPIVLLSCAMLMEPVASTVIGIILGVSPVPPILAWCGGFCVMAGISLVARSDPDSAETKDSRPLAEQGPDPVVSPVLSWGGDYEVEGASVACGGGSKLS